MRKRHKDCDFSPDLGDFLCAKADDRTSKIVKSKEKWSLKL